MYIKINEQMYNCSLSDKKNLATQVSFILDKKPELTNDIIEIYSSENIAGIKDKLLMTIDRKNYDREVITEFDSGRCSLLLSNIPEKDLIQEEKKKFFETKTHLIEKLTNYTSNSITEGIEYEGERFSFETHDQRNLTAICQFLSDNTDIESYLYHADGKEFREFSREDLFALRELMLQHITTYQQNYNIKKQLIMEASNLEELEIISIEKE